MWHAVPTMPAPMYKEPRTCKCGYSTMGINNWCKHKKCCKLIPNPKDALISRLEQQLATKDEQMQEQRKMFEKIQADMKVQWEATQAQLQEQLAAKDVQLAAKDKQLKATQAHLQEQREATQAQLQEQRKMVEKLQADRIVELQEELKQMRKRKQPTGRHSRTEPVRRLIAERQNWLCAGPQCRDAAENKRMEFYEIDHIVPLSWGGTEEDDNLQALCPNCHRKKTAQERLVAPSVGGEDVQR